MKLPTVRPSSNAFMVFSMLLLGVFAAATVVVFDYWNPVENRSLTTVVLKKLKDTDIPFLWITAIGGLTLIASGFFFYLLSFLFISVPIFQTRSIFIKFAPNKEDLFLQISDQALSRFMPLNSVRNQSRKFRDGFMYLLLTSRDTQISSVARFSFTQVMYARSIGVIIMIFVAYVSWVNSIPLDMAVIVVTLTWLVVCVLYAVGLRFFEDVVVSGVLIERLHQNRRSPTLSKKEEPATKVSKKDA